MDRDPYYPPEVDLLMAEILIQSKNYVEAKVFFEKAKEAKPYFLGTADSIFDYVESTLNYYKNENRKRQGRYIFWIFIIIFSLFFIFFLIWLILYK